MNNHHKGLYQHWIIQLIINRMWFNDKRDDGVVLDKVYCPFPFRAFTIVLTAIECTIDEWVSGTQEYVMFTIEAYKHHFKHHLSATEDYNTTSGDLEIIKKICQHVSDDGCINAKAISIELEATCILAVNDIKNVIEEFRWKDESLINLNDSDNESENGSSNGQPEVEDGLDH
ncbi:uncharacterized protein LAESUDRAFT_717118 [Laetiporus sulphureus 93-53]|uniref:DUF6532 domain-containing protein n=1 Tax=Laetiporus sulphureus 93-53 TaxID=1314785 RepID=A0A165C2R2_9APHY|nr:uncharacterized protein LAESUDRAFT_717118 [Laetiporus sulphureus 93-53]KZT02095.1 hypothetical protein LAESUDRAFT_717118 [Laetiporus sulphureus 93-53]